MRKSVLIADDDRIVLRRLSGLLVEHFEVGTVSTAQEIIPTAEAMRPGMIVLDIEMPDGNGIDVCRELKAHAELADVPIVFVSGHDDIDSRLRAYESGGQDFVVKSADSEELVAKLQAVFELAQRRHHSEEARQSAEQIAFSFLTNLGETGVVLECLRKICGANSLEEMAKIIIAGLAEWGLSGDVQVRHELETVSWGSAGPSTPLDISIIEHMRSHARIFQFKQRISLNYPSATLLISNLPTDDPDKCGRLRDHLAVLVESASNRAEALLAQSYLEKRTKAIDQAAARARTLISQLQEQHRQIRADLRSVMFDLGRNIEHSIGQAGLSDEQELRLQSNIESAMGEAVGALGEDQSITDALQQLANELSLAGSNGAL